ncbi:MAG TPA: hypothetical protein VL096_02880, partial [Pirellulaceae bacterium]|nr:hypothetical protein [Pirellulaceae bacterium]
MQAIISRRSMARGKGASGNKNMHAMRTVGLQALLVGLSLFTAPQFASAQWAYGYNYPQIVATVDPLHDGKLTNKAPVIALSAQDLAGIVHVMQAMEQPVACNFHEVALNEVLRQLQKESGCGLVIDTRALQDASIGEDSLVTLSLPRQSLRNVLAHILPSLNLDWYPLHGNIRVTTREEAETQLFVAIYPVLDLVQAKDGDATTEDYDSLIELITSTVTPNSWKEGGTGEGTIAPAFGGIAVAQSWRVHEELNNVLTAIRRVKTQQGIIGQQHIHKRDEPADHFATRPTVRTRPQSR